MDNYNSITFEDRPDSPLMRAVFCLQNCVVNICDKMHDFLRERRFNIVGTLQFNTIDF